MIRKLSIILGVVLLASIPIVAQSIRGSWKASGETFTIGSLHAKGTFTGVGSTDATVTIEATGIPVVICTNQGGNSAPGQNPSRATSTGTQNINGNVVKNGKAPLDVTADNPLILTWHEAGCANSNWTWEVTGVFWDLATITAISDADGSERFKKTYCLLTTSTAEGAAVAIVACPAP